MTHSTELNIFQRLSLVMDRVKYIKKESDTGVGGKGVARDAVVAKCRQEMLDAGIYVSTSQIGEGETRSLDKGFLYIALYRTSYINVDRPEDRHFNDHAGHGKDSGDKGPGKASTYAEKLNIIKALFLETGIKDEERQPEDDKPEAPKVAQERIDAVLAAFKNIGAVASLKTFLVSERRNLREEGASPVQIDTINEAASKRAGEIKAEIEKEKGDAQ